ncbi:stalk domain-containing protein [Acetivibrio cellulolyticus]|uniref:stalk domain-containing protein n=1 Tax=Acetivibrio cellulolyticus TaxID=35830 RepID=UPI0001E2FBAA|nr:stalk domain-containing protein [Acetivibrio cellulolyticus]
MRNLKRKGILIALVIMVCLSSVFYCDASTLTEQIFVTVKVNDKCIKMDSEPYIKDGRTYVSVRFIAEALGAKVEWFPEGKKVLIRKSDEEKEVKTNANETVAGAVYANENEAIKLLIGSKELVAYGEKKQMDAAAQIVNGRTMVPLRFVSENLDCDVKWDELTYSVLIYKKGIVVPQQYIENRSYTDEDLIWLARIVHVEVKGLSINGKVAVANVVLNRVKSPEFPDTVYDVIFASGQFPPVKKAGFKELIPSKDCIIAAKMALEGVNNVENCVYFNNVKFKSKNVTLYKRIDGEYFYY